MDKYSLNFTPKNVSMIHQSLKWKTLLSCGQKRAVFENHGNLISPGSNSKICFSLSFESRRCQGPQCCTKLNYWKGDERRDGRNNICRVSLIWIDQKVTLYYNSCNGPLCSVCFHLNGRLTPKASNILLS